MNRPEDCLVTKVDEAERIANEGYTEALERRVAQRIKKRIQRFKARLGTIWDN